MSFQYSIYVTVTLHVAYLQITSCLLRLTWAITSNSQTLKKNSATKIRLRSTVVWKGMEQAVQTIISWS